MKREIHYKRLILMKIHTLPCELADEPAIKYAPEWRGMNLNRHCAFQALLRVSHLLHDFSKWSGNSWIDARTSRMTAQSSTMKKRNGATIPVDGGFLAA
jgi:hypothetical protein